MVQSPTAKQVRDAIEDFRELHRVMGCDVEGILALLEGTSNVPVRDHPGPAPEVR
ncbi:hypothetical protein Aglo03_20780 [Actinokineospora globicatena]|uniref:Uncharacterized protein n=1 Tax=Actinokineospora globicatena TaxID=103729 RepID=A0A9W6V7D6_9PSEU|nr:hypothetical protein Aglo03_20780 [Actinokineospora globicatena]